MAHGPPRKWTMEFIGTVQFFNKNGKRSNPLALYLEQGENSECRISARLPQWRHIVGVGATPNKAAGDFEIKLKQAVPETGAYDGPAWNGIKAEKPAPPKPPSATASKPPSTSDMPSAPPASSTPVPAPASVDLPAKQESTEPV
jgi:hypothetical protein